MEFRKALTETRFLIVFNWLDWLNEHEIYKDTGKDIITPIRNADMDTLRKLMTSYIRGDRFNEGLFIAVMKNGTVEAILKRVKELQG
ncbi:DUF6508 domain-containing protein [Paenibacillus agilis]|uniref:DUF6508 domain-containing protein n=1 Tax=Paenibacillus agilis TaxID=3020863 RepID=UPI0021BD5293|nr:DUF6508 domain-containing protein [Paenibacillus agilis]